MLEKIDNFESKLIRLILSNWLILLSLFFVLMVTNCAGSRSVRNGGIYSQNLSDKTAQEENQNPKSNNINKAIEEYEKRIIAKKNPDTKLASTINSKTTTENTDEKTSSELRLPTLREQMQALVDEQKTIDKRVDTVNKDIQEIKSILKNIQNSFDVMYDSQKRIPETGGIKTESKKEETLIPKQDKKDYIILPDEKEKKPQETPKKLNKDELKKRAIAETFSADIKPKTNKIQKKEITKIATKKSNDNSNIKKSEDLKNKDNKNQEVVISLSDTVKLGINEFKAANYSKAINILTNSIKEETSLKNLSEIHFYIAESYFAIRDFRNSINYYTKVLDFRESPYKPKAQLKIAESNMRSGRIPEAKIAYEKLIQNYPESEYVPQARKMLQQL